MQFAGAAPVFGGGASVRRSAPRVPHQFRMCQGEIWPFEVDPVLDMHPAEVYKAASRGTAPFIARYRKELTGMP